MEEITLKRPLKAKNLKIIEYIGTHYATFDGTKIWKVEKWLSKLLALCNGKRSVNEIVQEIARISGYPAEDVGIVLNQVFEELERNGFITYF